MTRRRPVAEDPEDTMFRTFFAKAERDPQVVRCGTVLIDVPGVVERQVVCGNCFDEASARALAGKVCCATFRVPIERAEVRRIERVLPQVRRVRDVGAAIDTAGGFWREEDGIVWLRERPTGACVFLSAPPGGRPLCTLHEWAVAAGRDHRRLKPESCCLFPLYLVEWEGRVFITSYGTRWWAEMEPEETDDVKDFVCFHPGRSGRSLFAEQADELRYRLGAQRFAATRRKLIALGHAI